MSMEHQAMSEVTFHHHVPGDDACGQARLADLSRTHKVEVRVGLAPHPRLRSLRDAEAAALVACVRRMEQMALSAAVTAKIGARLIHERGGGEVRVVAAGRVHKRP